MAQRPATSVTDLNPASRLHRPQLRHRAKAVWHENVAVRACPIPINDAGSRVVTVVVQLFQTAAKLQSVRLFAALLSSAVQPFRSARPWQSGYSAAHHIELKYYAPGYKFYRFPARQ